MEKERKAVDHDDEDAPAKGPYSVTRNELGSCVISAPRASSVLPAGSDLWLELPFSYGIKDEHHKDICHFCFKSIYSVIDRVSCQGCQWCTYCTDVCRKAHWLQHRELCGLLTNPISRVAQHANVTPARVRHLLCCLQAVKAERPLNMAKDSDSSVSTGREDGATQNLALLSSEIDIVLASFLDVLKMLSNKHHFAKEQLAAFAAAAKGLLKIVPRSYRVVSVQDLVKLCCMTDTNCFGTPIFKYPHTSVPNGEGGDKDGRHWVALWDICPVFVSGFGLYPKCAQLNHSCYPSCHYVVTPGTETPVRGLRGPALRMRTSRAVPKASELTDSYTDLYCSRWTRRCTLLKTKHFICRCPRCVYPLERSPDRFLSGFLSWCCNVQYDVLKDQDVAKINSATVAPSWGIMLHCVANYLLLEEVDMKKSSKMTDRVAILKKTLVRCASWIISDMATVLPDAWLLEETRVPLCDNQKRDTTQNLDKEKAYRSAMTNIPEVDRPHVISKFLDHYDNVFRPADAPLAHRNLYQGCCLPVLLSSIPFETLSCETQAIMLARGGLPFPNTCEKCGNVVDADAVARRNQTAEDLWQRVINAIQQGDFTLVKSHCAVFLKGMTPSVLHPFHAWVYRGSQFLVNAVAALLNVEVANATNEMSADWESHLFFTLIAAIILLRHQLACQLIVLPVFNEDASATLHVLAGAINNLLVLCRKPIKIKGIEGIIAVERVEEAFLQMQHVCERVDAVLYGSSFLKPQIEIKTA